jgi:hypothetical protein
MCRSVAIFLILGLAAGCTTSDEEPRSRDSNQDRAAIEGLANRLAESIADSGSCRPPIPEHAVH